MFATLVCGIPAFAADAKDIRWSCLTFRGDTAFVIQIADGTAEVLSANRFAAVVPTLVGGPFQNLVTFGGGETPDIMSTDGKFTLMGGSLDYRSNTGEFLHLDDVKCTDVK